MRDAMKKTNIALLFVLVVGTFCVCALFISEHIEERVREKIALLPMTMDDIEYSMLSDTLRLLGFGSY